MSKDVTTSEIRSKLTQIYRYLQAFNEMKNPTCKDVSYQPWSLAFQDFPQYPTIQHGTAGRGEEENDDYILKVSRPEIAAMPEPPREIIEWLTPGWQKAEEEVKVIEQKVEPLDSGETGELSEDNHENEKAPKTILIRFSDDPDRPRLFSKWMEKRKQWLEETKTARKALKVFENLYTLYSYMERDSEQVELMIGDGMLRWNRTDGQRVDHPVLLLKVQLQFDPDIPEFTVVETESLPELYTALFRSMSDVIPAALTSSIQDLDLNAWHPLGGEDTSEFLKRLVTQLSAEGTFQEEPVQPKNHQTSPFMFRSPILFARRRNIGYAVALERILNNISDSDDFSGAVLKITGLFLDAQDKQHAPDAPLLLTDVNGEDEHILLSKEANAEQLQIAYALEQNDAVLVQGPPGTGKTHSIANLLGHLLAQGKSVLVTSHTTKALHVLREKVVEPLQPLCVSVLDDDSSSRQQMEGAIDAITDRLGNSNLTQLMQDANAFEEERKRILSQLRELRLSLKMARQDEYRAVVVAGAEYDPSKAARLVQEHAETEAWIPSPVMLGAAMPLSEQEVRDLYRTNVLVTAEDEREFEGDLPHPDDLLEPVRFEALAIESRRLDKENLSFRSDLWGPTPMGQEAATLQSLLRNLQQAAEFLQDESEWRMQAISAGQQEGLSYRQHWDELNQEIELVSKWFVECQPQVMKWGPELVLDQELTLDDAVERLTAICAHLEQGKTLSFFALLKNNKWKKLIEKAKVNGKAPEQLEHFQALRSIMKLNQAREQLLRRWERQVTAIGGPTVQSLGREPEKVARQFLAHVQQCLDWQNQQWLPLEQQLVKAGFKWGQFRAETPDPLHVHAELMGLRQALIKMPDILTAQIHRLAKAKNQKRLDQLLQAIKIPTASKPEVVIRLEQAVMELDSGLYRNAHERLLELHGHHSVIKNRRELISRLAKAAPSWAKAIEIRLGIHGHHEAPGNSETAWLWRQLHDELERRAQVSIEELQNESTSLREKLRTITANLVENKAWAAQVRNTTEPQRAALQGWKTLMRKAGKRTGARAPRLLAEARKLMPVCQSAVPVWIMPMSRVVENFDPAVNRFDVVIIDEASQSDMMALTALYLGKQIIVVGDDEQVSPESVGTRNDDLTNLIDTYLKGIPNAQLYDGISSIYDLAKTAFSMVGLKEHFRCVAPIIEFSNQLSYGGTIKPLRDASGITRLPHTVAYRVEGAVKDEKVNEVEAKAVASLLLAANEQPEYEGATFGVISMFGDEQAALIDLLLQKNMTAKEYQGRKIRCGNPAQFQGDERHVMFVSTLYSPGEEGPLRLLSDPGDRFKKRFNVAASRAQDQMWVVHSLDPEIDLKPGDIRRRFILHARSPETAYSTEIVEKRTESEFERRVSRILSKKGYKVTPQWPVGAYRIDMVIEGNGKRLAIECDGDRWHPAEKLEADMARQAILERLGWTFVRIRGSLFFRDPEKAMRPLFQRLEAMGIMPSFDMSLDQEPVKSDLKERVIRRADEIRREWEENPELAQVPERKKRKSKKSEAQAELPV